MKLIEKQPETEMEYWRAIETLGGILWNLEHELADGRLTDSDGEIDRYIKIARQISKDLVAELGERFGVIAPEDYPKVEFNETPPSPPEGKIYYWDWYKKMKAEAFEEQRGSE